MFMNRKILKSNSIIILFNVQQSGEWVVDILKSRNNVLDKSWLGNMKYSGAFQISYNISLHFNFIVVLFNVCRSADNVLDKSRLHYNVTGHSQCFPFEIQCSQAIWSILGHFKFPITLVYILILLSYYLTSAEMLIMCWKNHGYTIMWQIIHNVSHFRYSVHKQYEVFRVIALSHKLDRCCRSCK